MYKIEVAMLKCQHEEALMEELDLVMKHQQPVDQSLMDKLGLNKEEEKQAIILRAKENPIKKKKGYIKSFKSAFNSVIRKSVSPAKV